MVRLDQRIESVEIKTWQVLMDGSYDMGSSNARVDPEANASSCRRGTTYTKMLIDVFCVAHSHCWREVIRPFKHEMDRRGFKNALTGRSSI